MLTGKMQKYESVHVVMWLLKDSCWMLELKWLGAIVMVPTILIAAYIVYKTRQIREVYVNCAIFFWIVANSYWMMIEFFNNNHHKNLAAIPFALGFVFIFIYFAAARKEAEL